MPRDTRAVLFDLDDTLYPLDEFVLSGFDAVAAYLGQRYGIDSAEARTTLRDAFALARGRELQVCVRRFGLSDAIVPALVEIIRTHEPAIALPPASAHVLAAMSRHWRIGVVTNGSRRIQSRKVASLGLEGRVDAIVYADRPAKPDAAPFFEIARQLGVTPGRAIFVGNDPVCDVYGASRVGMKTIHVADGSAANPTAPLADASVRSLLEVPDIAERLVA